MADFLQKASECAAPLLLLGLLAAPSAALSEETGRFVLKEADQNTFIRLDTATGAVAHCASKAGEWSCKTLSDDRKQLHDEIAALKKENAELKSRLSQADAKEESLLVLPSDKDIDRVMALFEKYFERFLSFIRQLEEKHGGKAI
jgi:predicted RNase H-like nuclease (RuvC/YqgF family)